MAIAKTQRATQLRRRITAVGLLPVAFVAWRTMREWSPRLVLRNRRLRKEFHNRTRIPPGNLIFSATGTRDVNWFLESGEKMADAFRSALKSIGRPIESFDSVFELGCGCGRVLRQWTNVEGPMFFGSDYNPAGIEWAKENIGFASICYEQSPSRLCVTMTNHSTFATRLQSSRTCRSICRSRGLKNSIAC